MEKPAKKNITIIARLIIGDVEYTRPISAGQWHRDIDEFFPKTAKQITSEQYILTSLNFVRKPDE
jgi:hypothetical protein